MRPIAATFVVAPPAGVRVRARLKVDAGDEAVLGVIGEHLGSLAGKDLAARCKEGPLDASPRPFGAARWRIRSLSKASSSSSSRGHDAPRRRLIEDGAVLRYRGNFDWPGVAIANRVITYFGAVPWRMGRADYEAALAGAGRGLVDLPALEAPRRSCMGRRTHPVHEARGEVRTRGGPTRHFGSGLDRGAIESATVRSVRWRLSAMSSEMPWSEGRNRYIRNGETVGSKDTANYAAWSPAIRRSPTKIKSSANGGWGVAEE
jgi:hypothetical protein